MFEIMLIITLISAVSSFTSFLLDRRNPTKRGQRITCVLAVIAFLAAIASGALGYWASIETEERLQLTDAKVSEVGSQADRTQAQITEFITPRHMESETKRMLVASLQPHAGQKYDMKVFRDRDSYELATAIEAILKEAGWVHTNVYPTYATRYAETRDDGLKLLSGMAETTRTSEAREALHGELNDAGLYDDSTAFTPTYCIETTGPPRVGTKVTPIPCSESPVQITAIDFTAHDEVIPDDTLVLIVGKARP